MCLDVSPDSIHQHLGHAGTDIWWYPNKMRGVHIQEIIDYAMTRGKTFFPYEVEPMIANSEDTEPRPIYRGQTNIRFAESISGRVAILITSGHACAWDGGHIFDPKGFILDLWDYKIHEAWIMADLIKKV